MTSRGECRLAARQDKRCSAVDLPDWTAVDHHIAGRRRRVEHQRIAAHLEWLVDLTERPAPAAVAASPRGPARGQRIGSSSGGSHSCGARGRQRASCSPMVAISLRGGPTDSSSSPPEITVPWSGSTRHVNSLGSGMDCTTRVFVVLRRIVNAVDIGAAEFDRSRAGCGHQEANALVLFAGFDVIGVLHTDDLAGNAGTGHLQTRCGRRCSCRCP